MARFNLISIIVMVTSLVACGDADKPPAFLLGSDLLEICEQSLSGVCTGYIMGVVDSHAGAVISGAGDHSFCLGMEVDNNQLAKIVRDYMDNHPEGLTRIGPNVIMSALDEAFPCETQ